jgi:hypothetical protein
MLCPLALNLPGGGQTLSDLISGQANIPSGTHIDSLMTTSGVLLHEMMHWIQQGSKYIRMYKITFHNADYF